MTKTKSEQEHHHGLEITNLIFRGFIPLVLVVVGIVLLVIRLPGWGLIVGIPTVTIGVVFLITTYDSLVSSNYGVQTDEVTKCVSCGKIVPLYKGQDPKKRICRTCQEQGNEPEED